MLMYYNETWEQKSLNLFTKPFDRHLDFLKHRYRHSPSNGAIFNDLERSTALNDPKPRFQGHGVTIGLDTFDVLCAQLTRDLFAIDRECQYSNRDEDVVFYTACLLVQRFLT